jgi:hypothetical protein
LRAKLKEKDVVGIWQHLLQNENMLLTEAGEAVKVLYPGRLNDDRGADYRDAVIATERGRTRGDIEIHVRTGDWEAHGHHKDPAYNSVVLHVVMWPDTRMMTLLCSGNQVPVLALHKHLKAPPGLAEELCQDFTSRTAMMPCRFTVRRLPQDSVTKILEHAGEARFVAKAVHYQAEVVREGAAQALYAGVMEALGYSRNKLPFRELSRRVLLSTLEDTVCREHFGEECLARLQALLYGNAGLLPSQRPVGFQGSRDDAWVRALERIWSNTRNRDIMASADWHLFKVIPANSPIRRIAAMSYLVLKFGRRGMMQVMLDRLERTGSDGILSLERNVTVTGDGCWSSHLDLCSRMYLRTPPLIGSGRARAIVVNAVLPFLYAWGRWSSQADLMKRARQLFRLYPKLASNSMERHMKSQLGLSDAMLDSAIRQQGLLAIYKNLCTEGRCGDCPFNPA